MSDRYMTIRTNGRPLFAKITGRKDSEALHEFLIEFDPGDEYTVKFSDKAPQFGSYDTPRLSTCRCSHERRRV
jgi:hypothetical protein